MAPNTNGAASAASLPTPAEGHAFALRRGEPGATYSVTDARGITVEVRANQDGVVRPQRAEEVRVADELGLPHWHDPLPEAIAGDATDQGAAPENLSALTVAVLRSRLEAAGQDATGNKPALVERLSAHLEAEAAATAAASADPTTTTDDSGSSDDGSKED